MRSETQLRLIALPDMHGTCAVSVQQRGMLNARIVGLTSKNCMIAKYDRKTPVHLP